MEYVNTYENQDSLKPTMNLFIRIKLLSKGGHQALGCMLYNPRIVFRIFGSDKVLGLYFSLLYSL